MTIQLGINKAARRRKMIRRILIERDRRIVDNFTFEGRSYVFDERSQHTISRARARGIARIWVDVDDQDVTMDAATVKLFADAADDHEDAHILAARVLRRSTPIPVNFTDDIHWPLN
jgi:hypothetical protein